MEVPSNVIGGSAFYGCLNLTSVKLLSSVTTIGFGAFANCTSLTSVIIPTSVTTIEGEAFAYCTNLIIYAEVARANQPSGWDIFWNSSNRPVYFAGEWQYTGDPEVV
jgi:hypothetical protein